MPEAMETLITVLVIMIAIYVIDATVKMFFPASDLKKLKAEYESKLQEASSILGLSKEEFDQIVRKRISPNKAKSLYQDVNNFFLPSILDRKSHIESKRGTEISQEVISEIPSNIDLGDESRNVYQISNALIEIHRADLDYNEQGWQAVIDEVSDKRKKLVLSFEITPSSLYGNRRVIGDVTVVEEKQLNGDFEVKEYHLNSFHNAD